MRSTGSVPALLCAAILVASGGSVFAQGRPSAPATAPSPAPRPAPSAPAAAPAAPPGVTPRQMNDAIAAERIAAEARAKAERARLDAEIARLDGALKAEAASRDPLRAEVDALKKGAAKAWYESPIVVALASAALALLSSGALAAVNRRLAVGDLRKARAQSLIDMFIAGRAARAEALGVLAQPAAYADPANQNKVKGLGDSMASIAHQWSTGAADGSLLESFGMRQALEEFRAALERAAAGEPAIASLLAEWPEIRAVLGR